MCSSDLAATRTSKRVELVVHLERWDAHREHEDRLGLDEARHEILGLSVPLVRIPVAPGRNIGVLVEVAARNQLLKARGHHAARALAGRLDRMLRGDLGPEDPEPDDTDPGGHD